MHCWFKKLLSLVWTHLGTQYENQPVQFKGACACLFSSLINKSPAYQFLNCLEPFSLHLNSKSKNGWLHEYCQRLSVKDDEVDSLSDLTQICLEIRSQVSASIFFHISQEAKLFENLKSVSWCFYLALCEGGILSFLPVSCNIPYKNVFAKWGLHCFKNSRAASPQLKQKLPIKKINLVFRYSSVKHR